YHAPGRAAQAFTVGIVADPSQQSADRALGLLAARPVFVVRRTFPPRALLGQLSSRVARRRGAGESAHGAGPKRRGGASLCRVRRACNLRRAARAQSLAAVPCSPALTVQEGIFGILHGRYCFRSTEGLDDRPLSRSPFALVALHLAARGVGRTLSDRARLDPTRRRLRRPRPEEPPPAR